MEAWEAENRLPHLIQQVKQFQNNYRLTPTDELAMGAVHLKEACLYCPMLEQCLKGKNCD